MHASVSMWFDGVGGQTAGRDMTTRINKQTACLWPQLWWLVVLWNDELMTCVRRLTLYIWFHPSLHPVYCLPSQVLATSSSNSFRNFIIIITMIIYNILIHLYRYINLIGIRRVVKEVGGWQDGSGEERGETKDKQN